MTAPAPEPGRNRRMVARLTRPGVASALAFDLRLRELGNGWVDVTDRITAAADDDWIPVSVDHLPDAELLFDAGTRLHGGGLDAGDIMRSHITTGLPRWWVHDGSRLCLVTPVDLDQERQPPT